MMHETMLHVDQPLHDKLLNDSWMYWRAPPGKAFITCDNPIYADLGNLGMVVFPVSPQYVFTVVDRGKYGFKEPLDEMLEATEETWKNFNDMMAANAIKHLYHYDNEVWVADLKGHPDRSTSMETTVRGLLDRFNQQVG